MHPIAQSVISSTEPGKIFRGVKGTIIEISNKRILVNDYKTSKIRTLFIDAIDKQNLNIYNGLKVEINGGWIPFSLAVDAETIKEIENFD